MEKKEAFGKASLGKGKAEGVKGLSSGAPTKMKRAASARGPRGSADSLKNREEAQAKAAGAGGRSDSSSESEGQDDELQFVGRATADSGSDSSDASSEADEELQANFELFDPQDEDAAAVALLLRHSRVYTQLGLLPQQLRPLAEVIGGQGNIGSVARATTDADGRSEAAVGLVTLISVGQYPDATEPVVSKILSLAQYAKAAIFRGNRLWELHWVPYIFAGKLLPIREVSNSSKTEDLEQKKRPNAVKTNASLFISGRFTNLPLEVAAEAAEALVEDVRWSLETPEMEEDERPWYRFTHVIGVALVYRDPKSEKAAKKQKQGLGLADFSPTFSEFEHEVLSEGATVAFAAPTSQTIRFSSVPAAVVEDSRSASKRVSVMQTLQEYLLVYALPYERFELNTRKLKQRLALKAPLRT
ncbi:hypothetical protein Efla_002008 [Eimeria flavescens]